MKIHHDERCKVLRVDFNEVEYSSIMSLETKICELLNNSVVSTNILLLMLLMTRLNHDAAVYVRADVDRYLKSQGKPLTTGYECYYDVVELMINQYFKDE